MERLMARLIFLPLCLLLVAPAFAQTPSSKSSDNFASEPQVLKSASEVVTIRADGTGVDVFTNAIVIHSDSVLRQFSVISLSYASQSEQAEFVYARVVHPDGTVQETPVTGAIDQPAPVTQQAPFYSDIKIKQLPIKSLRTGDTLEWQGRIETTHPEAPNESWGAHTFTKEAVSLDETVELHVAPGVHLTVWTNPELKIKPEELDANGEHIYRWRHSDTHPTVGAEAEAAKLAESKRVRTPEEELDETKGELPSVAWTTFPDWAAVGAWYRSLGADRITPDAAIKAKVAELTAGKTTDFDKAQAVYQYVSTQIRYIGVAFGIGRYQPHTAAEVFANQYGDCKDKHTLLASMLSVLGIQAEPVLVGAGVRFNPNLPSPGSFNHVITHITLDGKDVWLDATAEVGRWGALLNVVRDQDALVVPVSSPPHVVHTPVELPYSQTTTLAATGSLDDSLTSDSNLILTFHDDTELYLRAALHEVSPANYSAIVQNLMANMGFGGTTSDADIQHLDDPAQPLTITFHYHRVPEKDWGENRITATFAPIALPDFSPDKPPVVAIQLGAPRTEVSTVEIQIPKGWTVQPPEEVHAHTPFVTCDVTFHIKDGKLTEERRLVVLRKEVPVSDYKQYKSWYDDADAGSVPYIQLYPPPKAVSAATVQGPKAPEGALSVADSNPEAAKLVSDAAEKINARDMDGARSSLDEAAKINPTQQALWASYAEIARLLGKPAEMINDLQRELQYHPDLVILYRPLAQIQLATKDTDGAIATLRAWGKVAPDSSEAALALVNQLSAMRRYNDAIKEDYEALKRLQSSNADLTDLKIAEATAEVGLGHMEAAVSNVAPLLAKQTDPERINDIAYVLAEAHSDLDDALKAQTSIVSTAEAATSDWNVDQDLRPVVTAEKSLSAHWDTLGWILYGQGKLQAAFDYLEAARTLEDTPEGRDHVTTVAGALHTAAAQAIAHRDSLKIRTISLGKSDGRSGVAAVTLLIGDGKVLDSATKGDVSSTTPVLHDTAELLKRADLRGLTPPDSKVHLLRTGFVNCHGGVCELVLAPIQ